MKIRIVIEAELVHPDNSVGMAVILKGFADTARHLKDLNLLANLEDLLVTEVPDEG